MYERVKSAGLRGIDGVLVDVEVNISNGLPCMEFTGMPGKYVPLKETLRGFRMILDGECDDLPESAFLFAGTIDDVFEKAK